MAWEGSSRRNRLPKDWKRIRSRVLRRDGYACQVVLPNGVKCLHFANEVDHIIAGDNHDESNLRAICTWHHSKKSGSEGANATAVRRKDVRQRFKREESHPGLL